MASQYDVFQAPQKHPQPPIVTTETVPVIVTVDSYGVAAASKYKYTVEISPLRDVVSIELIQATAPVGNGEDIYLILNVNGYSKVESNNNRTRDSFCIIPFQEGRFNMQRTDSTPDDNYIYYFPEPTRLSKLDIEFDSPWAHTQPPQLGVPVINNWRTQFGNEENILTFEIRTLSRAPKTDARYRSSASGPWAA
jgi:hypothetical protein